MKRKTTKTFEELEAWQPTKEEVQAFCKFIEKFMTWHEAKTINFNGKDFNMKAGKGYKESDGRNKAMAEFGAINLNYQGSGQIAIKVDATANSFVKSGCNRLILYKQFDVLERKYFNIEYAKQKSLEFFDQQGQPRD